MKKYVLCKLCWFYIEECGLCDCVTVPLSYKFRDDEWEINTWYPKGSIAAKKAYERKRKQEEAAYVEYMKKSPWERDFDFKHDFVAILHDVVHGKNMFENIPPFSCMDDEEEGGYLVGMCSLKQHVWDAEYRVMFSVTKKIFWTNHQCKGFLGYLYSGHVDDKTFEGVALSETFAYGKALRAILRLSKQNAKDIYDHIPHAKWRQNAFC